MKKMKVFLAVAAVAMCFGAFADDDFGEDTRPWFPLGLSIVAPPLQLPSPSHTLFGAAVNLGYGQMTDVAIADVGIVNNVTRSMIGAEVGVVNLAGTCVGAQVGGVNIAGNLCGVQVGAVNITDDLHGLQVGVLNFSGSGGAWVFPILNYGF